MNLYKNISMNWCTVLYNLLAFWKQFICSSMISLWYLINISKNTLTYVIIQHNVHLIPESREHANISISFNFLIMCHFAWRIYIYLCSILIESKGASAGCIHKTLPRSPLPCLHVWQSLRWICPLPRPHCLPPSDSVSGTRRETVASPPVPR